MAHLIESGWKRYKQVVSDNPEAVSQIEATSRVLSYIIAGLCQMYRTFPFEFVLFSGCLGSSQQRVKLTIYKQLSF